MQNNLTLQIPQLYISQTVQLSNSIKLNQALRFDRFDNWTKIEPKNLCERGESVFQTTRTQLNLIEPIFEPIHFQIGPNQTQSY